MVNLENKNIIWVLKVFLRWITIISITIEVVIFPSLENLVGCIMMLVSYLIFINFFFKRDLIIKSPFSFFMFLSMFLYRYLPLIATLIEGKPISYGMEYPIITFALETILFIMAGIAFYFSTVNSEKVTILNKLLNTIGFYREADEKVIWGLGLIGCIARILSLAMGAIAEVNAIGKILYVLFYYMYAPVIIFFPCLYKLNSKVKINIRNKKVWIYLVFISIINLASNSRKNVITPFCILVLLLFLSLIISNINLKRIIKPSIIIKGLIIISIVIGIMNITSKAMLLNRSVRNELSFTELMKSTLDTLISGNINELWDLYNSNIHIPTSYESGWTEDYIDNYLLNRFCNIRITDETLYLGNKLNEIGQEKMLENFKNRIISVLPQPIFNFMGINFNKSEYYNSRGDTLYVYSGVGTSVDFGGFRVTSHLGDGLATFGVLYFPIQFIMWYFVMKLLNTFSININKCIKKYSIYGLINSYTCLLMFSNANGMIDDILYCIRGYWQDIILFLILYNTIRSVRLVKITL